MKSLLKTLLVIATLSFTATGIAEQAHHPKPMDAGKSDKAMAHDMEGMDPAKMSEHLKQKQEHMLMMHDLSNRILAETDPAKQQALKDQQLEIMKAHHMKMMSMHHGKGMMHE